MATRRVLQLWLSCVPAYSKMLVFQVTHKARSGVQHVPLHFTTGARSVTRDQAVQNSLMFLYVQLQKLTKAGSDGLPDIVLGKKLQEIRDNSYQMGIPGSLVNGLVKFRVGLVDHGIESGLVVGADLLPGESTHPRLPAGPGSPSAWPGFSKSSFPPPARSRNPPARL